MGILEQYEKATEKKDDAEKKPTWQPTLKQIVEGDKADLFGKMLKQEGYTDLQEKIANNQFEVSDLPSFIEARDKFVELSERIEKTKSMVTRENVESVAKLSKDFEMILKSVGPEAATKILQKQIANLAVTERPRFDDIFHSMNDNENYKTVENNKIEKEISEFCDEHNIPRNEYFDVIAIEDDTEREDAMRELVKRNYGYFQRARNWRNKQSFSNADIQKIKDSRDKIESTLAVVRQNKEEIGNILACSIMNNVSMRELLKDEIKSEQEKPAEPIATLRELRTSIPIPTEAEVQTEWVKFKAEEHWDDIDSTDATLADQKREEIRGKFIESKKTKRKEKTDKIKKGGFWSGVFGGLFDARLDKSKLN